LQKFLNSQAGYNGSITKEISYQATAVLQMQDQQATLQTRLDSIQNNYITEYSNLNALLFQLNSTSTSLASALTALTNMAAGK
jgi:flagellar capping protein FliD